MGRDVEAADTHSKQNSCVRRAGVTTALAIRRANHPPSNLDFHGSSTASLAELTSVTRFTGGLLSIATPRRAAAAQPISAERHAHALPRRRLIHPLQETAGGRAGSCDTTGEDLHDEQSV